MIINIVKKIKTALCRTVLIRHSWISQSVINDSGANASVAAVPPNV